MGLEGIMVSETSQRKTNTICFYLYVESKNQHKQNRNKLIDTENKLMVTRWEEVGKNGKKNKLALTKTVKRI